MGALSRTIRSVAACGLIGVSAVMVSGCGFTPLYGPTASGAQLSDVMKSVDIAIVPGRVGLLIRQGRQLEGDRAATHQRLDQPGVRPEAG